MFHKQLQFALFSQMILEIWYPIIEKKCDYPLCFVPKKEVFLITSHTGISGNNFNSMTIS